MDRKKLIKRLIYLIFLILIANFLGNTFYWHVSIWYYDMIMHFLGGFWVGLVSFYFFTFQGISSKLILRILSLVLIIGIGWELFEILVNDAFASNSFNSLDTLSDIFFDLAGGSLSILYFLKRIMFSGENKV